MFCKWESSIKWSRENRKIPASSLPAEIIFASAHQSIIRERNRKKVWTYTEEAGELNSVPFSAINYQCDTRSVPQINISQAVSCNRSPLLDTLRSNTESTGPFPSVTGASVSCAVNTGYSYSVLPGPLTAPRTNCMECICPFSASKRAWTSPQFLLGLIPGLAWLLCSGIARGIVMSQNYVRNCFKNSEQGLSGHQSIRLTAAHGAMRKSKILNKGCDASAVLLS